MRLLNSYCITMNETDFSSLQDYILSHRLFISDLHGLEHWKQVEWNGLLLATETDADTTVVRLFALFSRQQTRGR